MRRPLRRVLVANRGEIAVRIIRACREADIESVAVYSDADAGARHVSLADYAERVGPPPPRESYLDIEAIIAAALRRRCDAIHPGYGFLSERAEFARAVEAAGLIFIGPPPDAIDRMGSKIGAREIMHGAGVPIVPGVTPYDQSTAGITAAAGELGYPVLVKASAGGGGRGMRLAERADAAPELIDAARREAQDAFGDGTLYVERVIRRARHVEIQVFGDAHGGIVHLFERECSLQRRHQKVIEESPAPALTPDVRQRMGAAAIAAARAVGYRNAGTVEFLVEGTGNDAAFYFLEMNTRLQVEHPVTEAVTGFDLVHAQLQVAAGEPLPWSQDTVQPRGAAIECRIYAEDPAAGFLPQAGSLLMYREPSGPGIRVDSGVREGDHVSVNYDALLAKLIATAETREAALRRAISALREFPVLGVRTNIPFLLAVLAHPDVRRGAVHTAFLDEQHAVLTSGLRPRATLLAAAAGAAATRELRSGPGPLPVSRSTGYEDPWAGMRGWGR